MMLGALFDKKMDTVRFIDGRLAICNGCGFAVFSFVFYSGYALGTRRATIFPTCVEIFLAFDFGTTLINEGHGEHH